MTPREFSDYAKGYQEAVVERHKHAIAVAFQGEVFAREKSLSSRTLKRALEGLGQTPKKQASPAMNDVQFWEIARAVNAAVGGKDLMAKPQVKRRHRG